MKYLIKIIFLFCFINAALSQQPNQKLSSYEGNHFFVAFMQNEVQVSSRYQGLKIYLTSSYDANIILTYPDMTNTNYSIKRDSVLVISIKNTYEVRISEFIERKAIEIESDVPVTVYAYNSQFQTSDSYSILPVPFWDREYVVMSMPNDQYYNGVNTQPDDSAFNAMPRCSEFLVMAAYDSTVIEFQPKVQTKAGKKTYIVYNIYLRKGDCYQVQSGNFPRGEGDLSGTIVRSNKPIGVLSGHVRSSILNYNTPKNDSKDHLAEMLFPTEAWGRYYISAPFEVCPRGDFFKMTSIYPNTIVVQETPFGTKSFDLSIPGSVAIDSNIATPAVWRSNQPVQLAQFMQHPYGTIYDPSYDPCMVMLPPVDLFASKIVFVTPRDEDFPNQYDRHFIYIIAHQQALPSLTLDGMSVATQLSSIGSQPILGTSYYWANIDVKPGKHELLCKEGLFSGVIFGKGSVDSYGMTLGSMLSNPYKPDSIPPKFTLDTNCGKLHGRIYEKVDKDNSGISFAFVIKNETYNYTYNILKISDTSSFIEFYAQPIDISKDGKFTIEYRDKNGNGERYSYFFNRISISAPKIVTLQDVNYIDSTKGFFFITNKGLEPVIIDSLTLQGDYRLSINLKKKFPIIINGKDSLKIDVSFNADGKLINLNANIIAYISCGLSININIVSNVYKANLSASGHDFGKVLVGNTRCDSIVFYNTGTIQIFIDSLKNLFKQGCFTIDYSKLLPRLLKTGDSLKVFVCFTPDSLGFFIDSTSAINDKRIQNIAILTGQGVAPNVQPIVIDWKKRRTKTINDTSIYIRNKGEYPAIVNYKAFSGDSTVFNYSEITSKSIAIQEKDSSLIHFGFSPDDTLQYNLKLELSVDWKFHKPVQAELKGIGTQPSITTLNYIFDTTVVHTISKAKPKVIISGGNEILTIDSIFIIQNDSNAFACDMNQIRNLKIAPSSTISLQVEFIPQEIGWHKLIIGVVNDAMPAYARRIDTIRILGIAVSDDTTNATVGIELNTPPFACTDNKAFAVVTNTGNVKLRIDKLDLTASGLIANWSDTINFPITIDKHSTFKREFTYFATSNKQCNISVEGVFYDTLKKTFVYAFNPILDKLKFNPLRNFSKAPRDTLLMDISGYFTKDVNIPISFSLDIDLIRSTLYLLTDFTHLNLKSKTNESNLILSLIQTADKILCTANIPVNVFKGAQWKCTLPFLVLLDTILNPKITIISKSDICFEPDTTIILGQIDEVCNFDLRAVKSFTNLTELKIAPLPITDKMNVKIHLPESDKVQIFIYNNLGEMFELSSNMELKKGENSLSFDVGFLPNGIYLLKLNTKFAINNSLFVISK
ncbi:MAG: Ig-like protein [Ignavibacteria bacterium]|nr:Ig-like protein [Ignavibacteria bacterium]